jgi:hypothetical protein
MRITVADPSRLSDGAHTEDVPLEVPGVGIQAVEHMLWIPFPSSFSPTNLHAFLQDAAPLWTLRPDACFLGIHPDSSVDEDVLDDVAGRVPGVPLFTVNVDHRAHSLVQKRGPGLDVDESATLDGLRQADLATLLLHAGVHLPQDPSVHYEAPGGSHYEAFLRAGFSLRSMEDLDRVAFWLAPRIAGRTHILVDHWSMIGLAYHVLGYARRLAGKPEIGAHVETLHQYAEGPELAVRLKRNFRGSRGTGVALVSVTSTGHLATQVMVPALKAAGHVDPVVVALAQPAESESEVPHLADVPTIYAPESSECRRCTEGDDVLLPIQRDSYLLSLSAYSKETAIRQPDAVEGKDLVNRYAGVGAFSVHRTHADGRHHAYYANVLPMLGQDEFAQRLDARISELPRREFSLAVAPDLEAAQRFTEMVRERVTIDEVFFGDEKELLQSKRAADIIENADDVLYLDDVVITGRRLLGYRRAIITSLRQRGQGDRPLDLWALVALARPRSRRSLQGVSDTVHHRKATPKFFAVEQLLLPNWDESRCPWCREERLLGRIQASGAPSAELRERLDRLASPEGLTDRLFLTWPHLPDVPFVPEEPSEALLDRYGDGGEWALRQGSVFGNVQGADLAASVASAMQELRSTIDKDGHERVSALDEYFRSPVSKVLDPALYISGRFYEPVLVASILRASHAHDLNPPGQRDLTEALTAEIRQSGLSTTLFGEIVLQIAEGSIAPLPEKNFTEEQREHPLLGRFLAEAEHRRRRGST